MIPAGGIFETENYLFLSIPLSPCPPQALNIGPQTSSVDPVNPVDYERFVHENSEVIRGDSQCSLLLFPDGDVTINTVQRKFRTVQYPVPGQAK